MADKNKDSSAQTPPLMGLGVDGAKAKPLPFVAPCVELSLGAPLRWLKLGFKDARNAPLLSLGLGTIMSAVVLVLVFTAWQVGSAWAVFLAIFGSVFLIPLLCIGTYAVSAQLERGMTVSIRRTFRASFQRYIGTELVFALALLVVFLVWARASSMISIFLPSTQDYSLTDMILYFGAFAAVGSFFLTIVFAASVFALPMIMHRDVDAVTAIVTSINAVLRNKTAMLFWGLLILLGISLSLLTGGVLLVLFLPAVGHAVWHGYMETVDASEFPRHTLGITATPRHLKS